MVSAHRKQSFSRQGWNPSYAFTHKPNKIVTKEKKQNMEDLCQLPKSKDFSSQLNHRWGCGLLPSSSTTASQPDGNFQAGLVLTPDLLPKPEQHSPTCHPTHPWGEHLAPFLLDYFLHSNHSGHPSSTRGAPPTVFPQPTIKPVTITQEESSAVVSLMNPILLSV